MLSNGLRVWSVRHASVPVVTYVLLLLLTIASQIYQREHLATDGFIANPEDEVRSPLHGLDSMRERQQISSDSFGVHGVLWGTPLRGILPALLSQSQTKGSFCSGGVDGAVVLGDHDAALGGNRAVVQLLLDHGAEVNARDEESGATPLYYAASWGRMDATFRCASTGSPQPWAPRAC